MVRAKVQILIHMCVLAIYFDFDGTVRLHNWEGVQESKGLIYIKVNNPTLNKDGGRYKIPGV